MCLCAIETDLTEEYSAINCGYNYVSYCILSVFSVPCMVIKQTEKGGIYKKFLFVFIITSA